VAGQPFGFSGSPLPSRIIPIDALRMPNSHERPRFTADVPPPIQAHIWIKWLQGTAARRQAKGTVYLSVDGAEDLASLITRLAQGAA
jgi:hypothetical protein